MKTTVIHSLLVIFVLFYHPSCQAIQFEQGNNAPNVALSSNSKETIEIEKLRQEVLKLQLENENIRSPWAKFSSNAAFITAIVAFLGVFVTIGSN